MHLVARMLMALGVGLALCWVVGAGIVIRGFLLAKRPRRPPTSE